MSWIALIGILVFLVLAFLVWASADVGSGVWVKARCRAKTSQKVVALTFDDGPAFYTPQVLDVLRQWGVHATFFMIGSQVEGRQALVKRVVAEGHTVAVHTWSHSGVYPLYSAGRIREELLRTTDVLEGVTGRRPRLFRPPFGVTNPNIASALRPLGWDVIGYNIRSLDTVSGHSRESVCRRIERRLVPGSIILLHDRCPEVDSLLKMLLESIRKKGYKVVPLKDLLELNAYEK